MSIEKRNGVWYVRFQRDGKTVRRSAGKGATRVQAAKLEKALRASKAGSSTRTVGDAIVRWMQSGAPKSMHTHIRGLRPFLETVPITEVIPAVSLMKDSLLQKGLSRATVNRRLACVKRMLNLAFNEWEWIDQPLAQRVKLLSERGNERHVYLTIEQVATLVGHIKNDKCKKLTLLAAYTGLRAGELLRLQPSNWRKPLIVLDAKTKGKRPRTVPLVEELWPLMDQLPLTVTPKTLGLNFRHARKQCGLDHVHFHDLRHTFASWLVSKPEVPLAVIRDLLGHSSLSMTSRYTHLRVEALHDAIRTLK